MKDKSLTLYSMIIEKDIHKLFKIKCDDKDLSMAQVVRKFMKDVTEDVIKL